MKYISWPNLSWYNHYSVSFPWFSSICSTEPTICNNQKSLQLCPSFHIQPIFPCILKFTLLQITGTPACGNLKPKRNVFEISPFHNPKINCSNTQQEQENWNELWSSASNLFKLLHWCIPWWVVFEEAICPFSKFWIPNFQRNSAVIGAVSHPHQFFESWDYVGALTSLFSRMTIIVIMHVEQFPEVSLVWKTLILYFTYHLPFIETLSLPYRQWDLGETSW